MAFLHEVAELLKSPREWALIIAMALVMQYSEYHGLFGIAEGYALNAYQRDSWYDGDGARIVTIGITAQDVNQFFGGTSPLAPDAVRSLVATIQLEPAPAVIGVDLITDAEAYRPVTDSQQPWPQAAGNVVKGRRSSIVWAAGANDARVERAPFIPRLLHLNDDYLVATPRFVLNRDPATLGFDWGLAVYVHDDDGVVRRLPREWHVDAERAFENTFARQVARAYCRARADGACDRRPTASEVYLPFDRNGLQDHHRSVSDLFRCNGTESNVCTQWEFKGSTAFKNPPDWPRTIVLLGGDSPDMNDWHRTPINERTPGVWINASAVRAELSGPRIEGLSHLWSSGLDLFLGFLTAAVFGVTQTRRLGIRILLRIGAGAATAIGVGYLLFWSVEMLWVSWVGMLIAGSAWDVVVDLVHKDVLPPPTPTHKEVPPPTDNKEAPPPEPA